MALLVSGLPPCALFEDDHLLVLNKPAGLNTHAPSPYAGEGLYDWLRHREPRWNSLAIIHRLDKDTSGVIVFGKTPMANRSLTAQFSNRAVRKKYLLLTDRPVPAQASFTVRSRLVRLGEKYVSRQGLTGVEAETRFRLLQTDVHGQSLLEAEPVTGRTHQIRVHAADRGLPIKGDLLYGGTPARRLCLHAAELTLQHPGTGLDVTFKAAPDFELDVSTGLRAGLVDTSVTDSYRLIHGAADRWPGWILDRLGPFLLSVSENPELTDAQRSALDVWIQGGAIRGVYHKQLSRQPGKSSSKTSPQHVCGEEAPDEFAVLENGIRFALSLKEGYSVGLFLDQRDNRRRLLLNHVAAGFPLFPDGPQGAQVLNTFAYTCGFSVCAAQAGATSTSLDLSRRYLDWGQRNFRLNQLSPDSHQFIYGDALDWMRRLARKGRAFDLVILDPPTFSRSKESGAFQVEKDYERLVKLALPILKPGGVILASTNSATLKPESFLAMLGEAIASTSRTVTQQHYAPQPPDFPVTRDEPAYLKTVWMRIG